MHYLAAGRNRVIDKPGIGHEGSEIYKCVNTEGIGVGAHFVKVGKEGMLEGKVTKTTHSL